MVQIKVTPEMLEEVANRASNTRIALESIHNKLCNEIDQLCFQWIGASNQQFIQMFNDARPKAFTSIHSLVKVEEDLKRIAEKFRNTDNQDVTMEKGAMCGPLSSGKEDFDGEKLARDIVGEISGEYDIRRAWDGIDPSTGEKLSTLDRVFAGGMAVAGLTPFGKIAKVGKGVKMTAKATEAVNKAKKVPVEKVNGVKGTGKVGKGNSDLLDNTDRFKDAELQTKYDVYCERKYKNGEAPKEPLEWKEASEKWASLKEQGQEFSDESFNLFSQQYENAQREITIVTHEGTKVRVDAIASDEYGNVIIQEYKSSATAPYTTNQEKGFPELKNSGGEVVGEGKGDFSGGYEVPSGTRPQIVRPEGTTYFDE